MKEITATAILHLLKPVKLVVSGTVTVYHQDDRVKVSKAEPQGINQNILILDLEILQSNGPMKGIQKGFEFILEDNTAENYNQVTIRNEENGETTIDVDIVKS